MKKRFFVFLLMLIVCVGMISIVSPPVKVYADDIASGVYDGVDWRITAKGELLLGNGTDQTFADGSYRFSSSYPWYAYRASIISVHFDGIVRGNGDMAFMFYQCANLILFDAQGFDTSNVTNMGYMFGGCSSINSLDLSSFNTSNMQRAIGMFYDCSSLVDLNINNFDTSNVVDMERMFRGCSSLTKLDLSSFNTHNTIYLNSYFGDCVNLKEIKISENFNFKGVTNESQRWAMLPTPSGTGYTGKWVLEDDETGDSAMTPTEMRNAGIVTPGTWVWEVKENPYAVFDDTTGTLYFVKSYESFSNNSTGTIHSISGGEYTGTIYIVDETASSQNWSSKASQVKKVQFVDEIRPTSTASWFQNFSNCTEMNLAKLNTSRVTSMNRMFDGCSNLTSLDVSSFHTNNVTDMYRLFHSCSSLVVLNLSNFDTHNVVNMRAMFNLCKSLTALDLSNFNTSNVTNMAYMFSVCPSMQSLNMSNFDTHNVTEMQYMFNGMPELKSLDLSSFNTSKCTNFSYMFGDTGYNFSTSKNVIHGSDCGKIKVLDLNGFVISGGSTTTDMFAGLVNLEQITLGTGFRFNGAELNKPYHDDNGKWVAADGSAGPYKPAELSANYSSDMSGIWIWQSPEYKVDFIAPEEAVGSMASVGVTPSDDYILPLNLYQIFGYEFDHWDDGNGHEYADRDTIPANTYADGDTVTLTAVFVPRDTSFTMEDGAFEIKLRAGEKAVLPDLPAGTAYQIWEETPDGWVLVKQKDASGVIQPLTESNAVFHNKYQPGVTTAQFSGIKTLDGNPASAGSYNFELKDANGNIIETVATLDGGFIQFSVIQYEETGTYEYTINEVDPEDDSIDYDAHIEHVKVTVTDDGHGNLSSEVTYDSDGIVFNNKTRPGSLRITKEANNLTDANQNDTFAFKIHFYNANGTPVEDGQIYWYIEDNE